MKQGVLLIMGIAEAHGTYARSEIRTLLQRSMFTNVSIHHQIRSPWVPASEAATLQHPPRLMPVPGTLSALWHNGPTFLSCRCPRLGGGTCTLPWLCPLTHSLCVQPLPCPMQGQPLASRHRVGGSVDGVRGNWGSLEVVLCSPQPPAPVSMA